MVKFLQDTIQISRNIISSIPDMTGIQTDAKLIGQLYTVNNRAQFLKASAHLTAFSRHRLEQNRRRLLRREHLVKCLRNPFDSGIRPLSDMGTRVKIVVIPRRVLHPAQIVRDHLLRKLADILLRCAQIHRVRCMRHQFSKLLLPHQFQQLFHIRRINRFCRTASRISCKKCKCICSQLHCHPPHRRIAL